MKEENNQSKKHLDVELFKGPAEIIRNQLASFEAGAEMRARELCEWFYVQRKEIQARLGEATTKQEYRERFAPLTLHSRVQKGSLEIYWSETKGKSKPDINGKSRFFRHHLKKGKRHSYDMRMLASKACDYELDLVLEAERRATELRDLWSGVVSLRLALRGINRKIDQIQGEGAEVEAQPSVPPQGHNLLPAEKMPVPSHDTVLLGDVELPLSDWETRMTRLYDG